MTPYDKTQEPSTVDPVPKGEPGDIVNWRLPTPMVERLGGDGIRDLLSRWLESGAKLDDPPHGEPTKTVCYAVPHEIVVELERVAKDWTRRTGRRWTAAKVAAEVWRQWE